MTFLIKADSAFNVLWYDINDHDVSKYSKFLMDYFYVHGMTCVEVYEDCTSSFIISDKYNHTGNKMATDALHSIRRDIRENKLKELLNDICC